MSETAEKILRFRVRQTLTGCHGRWRVELVDERGVVNFETPFRFHDRQGAEAYIESLILPDIVSPPEVASPALVTEVPDIDDALETDRAVNRVLKHMVRKLEPLVFCILFVFPLLAFGQGVTTIRVPEGSQVVIVRESTNAVTNELVVAAPKPPPTPPTPMSAQLRVLSQQLGKEVNHYTMPVSVLVTQTVTTVYRSKFLRVIEVTANATNSSMQTNFLPLLGTNVVSSVTNSSPTTP